MIKRKFLRSDAKWCYTEVLERELCRWNIIWLHGVGVYPKSWIFCKSKAKKFPKWKYRLKKE